MILISYTVIIISKVSLLSIGVWRYRECWLPLAAAAEKEDIEPPLDVHWMW